MIATINYLDQISYVFENLPYGVLIENREREIHSVNSALLEIFDLEYEPKDLKGFSCNLIAEIVGNNFEDKVYYFEIINNCILKKIKSGPFEFQLSSGKFLELSYIPYYTAENEFLGHSWCYADITKQKNSDQKLTEQTIFFKNILDSIPADIVLFNKNHQYQFINKAAIKDDNLRKWMIGKNDEDYFIYRNKSLVVAKERKAYFDRAMQTKSKVIWEDFFTTKEGKEQIILRILQPYLSKINNVEFVVGYGIDVTDFKIKTLELVTQEAKSSILQTQIKSIVFSADLDLKFIDLNPAWGKITGLKNSSCLRKNLFDYIEENEVKQKITAFYNDDHKKEISLKFRLKIKGNHLRWVEGFIFKEISLSKKAKSFWGVLTDIEKQVRTEENLVSTINKEKELNELKSNFVNMVSHEVRTPLAGILSSVELLEIINKKTHPGLIEKNSRHFNRIKDQIIRISDLMNNVLILGKIESGSVAANLEDIDLVKNISSFLTTNFSFNNEYDCIFNYHGNKKFIRLDWKLITHVLTNLIGNALKYSAGKPKPEIDLLFEEKNASITIKDYGIGIPTKDLSKLFVPFQRGSNVNSINGTGLGLVLVKYFIELHKGKIKIESKINEGTIVKIDFSY
jgi:PAS domain S-box-containing protein